MRPFGRYIQWALEHTAMRPLRPPKGLLCAIVDKRTLYVYDGVGWCEVASVVDTLGRSYRTKVTSFMLYESTETTDDDTEQTTADGDT